MSENAGVESRAKYGRKGLASKTIGRKSRKIRASLLGAATATALTMGLTSPSLMPEAGADMTFDVITTGPLFWLVDRLGYDHIETDAGPPVGTVTVNLNYTKGGQKEIYDAINAVPFSTNPLLLGTRAPIVLGDGPGAYATVRAYQALIDSAQGNTLDGYDPLAPNLVPLTPNQTNALIGLVRNPTRPNGGFYSRFPSLAEKRGIDSELPDAGIPSGQVSGVKLNTSILDLTLAYESMSDFPVNGNLFALANSMLATFLPTYLLEGDLELMGTTMEDIQDQIVNMQTGRAAEAGQTLFGTFVSSNLPLLELMRWPVHLINFISKQLGHPLNLRTPLADALQPALEILVNIGYSDVQTPTEGGTYNRTFDDAGVATPWRSVQPLTQEERRQVPGDVVDALVNGFRGMFGHDDQQGGAEQEGDDQGGDTEEGSTPDDDQSQSSGGIDGLLNGIGTQIQDLLHPASPSPAASALAGSGAARLSNAGPAARHSSATATANRSAVNSAHRGVGASKRVGHHSESSE